MKPQKREKLTSLLSHLAAEFLERETGNDSMITVTGTSLSEHGEHLDILFTVLPEQKEQGALGFANRRIGDFRDFIKKRSRIGRIPSIKFDAKRIQSGWVPRLEARGLPRPLWRLSDSQTPKRLRILYLT